MVISDLARAYEGGTAQISSILSDFENETRRTAMTLEPVRMNSDELYAILRKRLFASLPPESEIIEVSQAYARAIRDARQMDITNESPERFAERVQVAYPFHPAIRDLYARFRENQGFQQTRGLIRLMRIVVSRLWNSGLSEKRYLIAAHDLDFNDRETRSEISQINNTLENAIAHDIAAEGAAVAEIMDGNLGGVDAQDACRLLMISSLANVPNAILGLSIPELVANLAEPGRDLARLRSEVLAKLSTAAWYLHSDRDGKLFFRNTENLIAKLESLVRNYLPEQALKELRTRLSDLFKPINAWCYQKVLALPAVDEIELNQDDVALVITEPFGSPGLRPDLKAFWEQSTWKNRLAFLTGPRNTYETLLDSGKRLKAIQHILDQLKADHVPDNDPQMVQAKELSDRIRQNFHSAVRETFTTIWYPIEQSGSNELISADFSMLFEGNLYSGEGQILNLLKEKMKFTDEVTGEIFRKKCEQRLFTAKILPWVEIKRRAGMLPKWQWHHPNVLDELKADCLQKDIWREQGGFVDKGPFPQPKTNVDIKETYRDDNSGEATLHVSPLNADTIYYDIGAQATTASAKLDGATLKTRELRLSFLAVDSTGVHETGEARGWENRITIKYRIYQSGADRKMELRAAPIAKIHYTTDGSDPKVAGATYESDFVIPFGAPMVLAYAEQDGIQSQVERIPLQWGGPPKPPVDPDLPVTWKRKHSCTSTKDTYELVEKVRKYHAKFVGITVTITGEGADQEWIELTTFGEKHLGPDLLEESLGTLRNLQTSGQIRLESTALYFETGQDLLDWVEDARTEVRLGEVKQ